MYAGQFVEFGPTREVFTAPRHHYSLGLLNSIPDIASDRREPLRPVLGRPPSVIDPPAGCRFAPRCGFATDVCRTQTPPLTPLGSPDHLVACWHPVGDDRPAAMCESAAVLEHEEVIGS